MLIFHSYVNVYQRVLDKHVETVDFPYLCQVHVSIFEGTQNTNAFLILLKHYRFFHKSATIPFPFEMIPLISAIMSFVCPRRRLVIRIYQGIYYYVYIYTPKIIQTHIYIYIYHFMIHDDKEDYDENDAWQPPFGFRTLRRSFWASIPIALYCWLYMYIENITYTWYRYIYNLYIFIIYIYSTMCIYAYIYIYQYYIHIDHCC